MTLQKPSSGPSEPRSELSDEIHHTLAARRELGPDLDDELVEAFAERIRSVISSEVARQVGSRSQETKQLLDWRKEMYAITLGCGIPIVIVAAIVGGGWGVVSVCLILAVVAIAVTWRSG